jgi:putative hydroxymethylpyrimidine transport system substrate-binding protein
LQTSAPASAAGQLEQDVDDGVVRLPGVAPPRAALALLAVLVASALALAAGGCGGGGDTDRPNADATLILDFTPNAVHAGIYSAVARGYDEAEGVNLRVREPSSSSEGLKLLLAERAQFALLDIHDLALARERGRDVVGVLALVQRPLAAVLAAPGVRRPADLQGRSVGVTGLPSDDAVLRSVVSGDGGDPDRVREVTIGFNAVASLLGGRVDGATAFWDVEGVALRRRRPGFREFRVDQFGAPSYPELVLCVTRRTLDEDPSLVRAAVSAIARGYDFTLTDPESSAQDLLERVRDANPDLIHAELDAVSPAFMGDADRYGELSLLRLRAWAAWEARFGITRRPPDVDAAFAGPLVAR